MMNKILVLFLIILSTYSCSKKKPPIGNYLGIFKYEYPTSKPELTVWYKITESEKDYLLITTTDYAGNSSYGGDTLYKKNKKKIEGRVPIYDPFSSLTISGIRKYKLFGKYSITGTFIETIYQGGNQYQYSGTVEIYSR